MDKQTSTKDKILQAARQVFVEKGRSGTRMHEISNLAGVNKAMLFYYFTSKDKLYEHVLYSFFFQIFTQLRQIIVSESDRRMKLEQIIDAYISFIHQNPELPKLLMREIADGAHNINKVLNKLKSDLSLDFPGNILNILQDSIDKGEFRTVDPVHTLISIIGMSLMYFIGKPIIETAFDLEQSEESQFISDRKKSIVDLLEYGLLAR